MISWFRQLDDLLRGRKTEPEGLAQDRVDLPLSKFLPLAIVLGVVYGFFVGWYALFNREPAGIMQLVASTIKLPALFLLTLVVTFPSLYVFNALVGCRLALLATLRLLVGTIVVILTVATSLGPILGFFTLSTTSYPFMITLNVLFLTLSGLVGLGFLLNTLRRFALTPTSEASAALSEGGGPHPTGEIQSQPGPLEQIPGDLSEEGIGQARVIFRIWILLFGLVGAQMGWLLRPFIGSPDLPFTWFRAREGNFFLSILQQLQHLFSSG